MQNWKKILSFLLRLTITVFLFFYIFSRWVTFADYVVLQNGQQLHGDIVQYQAEQVTIRLANGEIRTIPFAELRRQGGKPEVHWGFYNIWRHMDVVLFFLFSLLFFAEVVLSAFRFKWLLAAQSIGITVATALKINFIGYFFNNFLPGSTGGDLVRAFYIAREAEQKTRAVMAVIMDRIVGLWALVLLAMSVLVWHLHRAEFFWPGVIVLTCFAGIMVAMAIMFLLPERLFANKTGMVWQVVAAFCHYRHFPRILLYTMLVSLVIHILSTIAFIGFAYALGITHIPWSVFFVYIPVGFLLMAVPVSLSGWGVGEATYSFLFAQVGVPMERGVILSLLMRIAMLEVSVTGACVWLLERSAKNKQLCGKKA
jgi:uncharacterized membrane protein YbhN (UPF0104 family)